MWVFTRYGFFSTVCARQGDGRYGQPVDPDRVMVRARVGEHLEALKRRFPARLEHCDIHAFVGTDYAFRLFVAKSVWSEIMAELAEELDYDNFKDEVSRQGAAWAAYERSLHPVWRVMFDLQRGGYEL